MLLAIVLIAWGYYGLRRKLMDWPEHPAPVEEDIFVPNGDAVELLKAKGYELLSGKQKIPVTVEAGGLVMSSQLFIDAIAAKDDETFVVRIARPRRPLEWTGSAIREHLLVYSLIYDDIDGVLYVDPAEGRVTPIRFELER
ncbi:hypothetical protein GCM10027018_14900 [Paenibacillus thermoaerophilus]